MALRGKDVKAGLTAKKYSHSELIQALEAQGVKQSGQLASVYRELVREGHLKRHVAVDANSKVTLSYEVVD